MSLSRNLLAGLANSIWSALTGLAVVPFYLKYLGIESYGLVGFFVTMQAVMSLLDMGIAPTINREVARCSATGNLQEAGKLLHSLAVVYWSMAGAIALFVFALAPLIADYWLQSKQLSPQTISHAVMLMGLVIACRWPIGLYQGALIGAQRLTVSSSISIAMVTVGNLGAVAVLAFVSPTIEAFFIWQACVGLVYAAAMRLGAWWVIGRIRGNRFDVNALKRIWRFTAGMSAITLMGLIFSQMDKVLLSKILCLEDYAHYMLASLVVAGLYVLVTPMYNIIYPQFSALVASGDIERLGVLYKLYTRSLSIVLFPAAMIIAVFSKDLIFVWTGNADIAKAVAPLVSLLAIGSALNGIMYIPHALQLAFGMTKLPLMINGILMIIFFPLIIYLALKFGSLGGAIAWLLLHTFYVFLGTWLTHRHLLKGFAVKWLLNDLGVPIAISLLVGIVAKYVCQDDAYSVYMRLAIGGGVGIFAVAAGILLTPQLLCLLSRNSRSGQVVKLNKI